MKRWSVLLTAALLAGGVVVLLSSSGSAQETGPRTLVFTEKNAQEFATTASSRRLSPDDSFVFRARLLANGQPAGREQGACTAIARNATECQATLFFNDGKIFVSGGTVFASRTVLAVVGGTGAYAGARGTMTVLDRKSGDRLEVALLG